MESSFVSVPQGKWLRLSWPELLLATMASMAVAPLVNPVLGAWLAVLVASILLVASPRAFFYVLVVLLPFPIQAPADFAIRDLASLARFALFVVTLAYCARPSTDWFRKLVSSRLTLVAAGYVAICLVTVAAHGFTYFGTRAAFRLTSVLAFYGSALLLLETKKQIKTVILLLLLSTIALCLYGLWQFAIQEFGAMWHAMYDSTEIFFGWTGRITSFFLNDNPFAAYLNVTMALAIPLTFIPVNRYLRVLAIVSTAMSLACLLMTQSRGGLLAFIAMLLAGVAFFPVSRATRITVFGGVLTVIAAYIALVQYLPERYSSLTEGDIGRLAIWTVAIDQFSGAPIAGIGYGGFRDVAAGYLQFILDTHNLYLKLLAETGILGAGMYLTLKIMAMRFAAAARRASNLERVLAFAVVGSIVTELVHGLVDVMLEVPQIASLSFLLLALFVTVTRLTKQDASENADLLNARSQYTT